MIPAYRRVVAYYSSYDFDGIKHELNNLRVDLMKMDKFFSLYLEKFDRKMDSKRPNTPIWALYKKKLHEYGELKDAIRAAEYYLKKSYV